MRIFGGRNGSSYLNRGVDHGFNYSVDHGFNYSVDDSFEFAE